jgi:hypothetical protein
MYMTAYLLDPGLFGQQWLQLKHLGYLNLTARGYTSLLR